MFSSATRIPLLVWLSLMFLPLPANAIVDMESIHLGKKKEGFSGRFELSAYGASGNTEKEETSLGAKLEWNNEAHTAFSVINYSYGQSRDETNIDKGFAHLRYIFQFHDSFASEIFVQANRDEFRRLTYRGIVGTGIRHSLFVQEDVGAIILGAGAFYEKEALIRDDSVNGETITEIGRANLYMVLKYRISESSSLVSSTYYQPNLRYSVDYRASESASLIVKVNDEFAVKLGVVVTHDSQPPVGVEQTDLIYRTSILYQF